MKHLLYLTILLLLISCSNESGSEKSNEESKEKETNEETMTESDEATESSYTVKETTIEPKFYLYMADTIVMGDVAKVLGEFFPAVFQYGKSNGLAEVPPTAQVIGYSPEKPNAPFLLKAGMMTIDSITPGENMKIERFYEGKVLMTTHVGPYDQVSGAYNALYAEAAKRGFEVAGDPWEAYTNDPGEVGIENAETVVYLPVKK